ncbi:hypothetical protein K7I13_04915 [Brucepastera parasyntrophica]|uniref:hypothetical protein n=1 Tax=Brucepastera parasyntrophica TaxID=2880008 RepID=UPI00210A58CF|nr:hypothetical protein [Brucepastera parasyntrophica]ULQ60622.1 hypothetical protein K7I13_04915 [Brucepastera parasyntrophica]
MKTHTTAFLAICAAVLVLTAAGCKMGDEENEPEWPSAITWGQWGISGGMPRPDNGTIKSVSRTDGIEVIMSGFTQQSYDSYIAKIKTAKGTDFFTQEGTASAEREFTDNFNPRVFTVAYDGSRNTLDVSVFENPSGYKLWSAVPWINYGLGGFPAPPSGNVLTITTSASPAGSSVLMTSATLASLDWLKETLEDDYALTMTSADFDGLTVYNSNTYTVGVSTYSISIRYTGSNEYIADSTVVAPANAIMVFVGTTAYMADK